jgi:hypothetical protein
MRSSACNGRLAARRSTPTIGGRVVEAAMLSNGVAELWGITRVWLTTLAFSCGRERRRSDGRPVSLQRLISWHYRPHPVSARRKTRYRSAAAFPVEQRPGTPATAAEH